MYTVKKIRLFMHLIGKLLLSLLSDPLYLLNSPLWTRIDLDAHIFRHICILRNIDDIYQKLN